ncbi:type III restriction endonuclease subunit M [Mycoplasma tauri]|uniref:type III restriction endonuclease subunit M n=1 Tax=Mycoplasma tauri TaxID=547987 RepID=UPI001E32BC66|nr:type III restriction endonuclease subunit M [Mycoplasma tauri]
MTKSLKSLEEYKKDIENMSKSLLNTDQKNLIIEILENAKEENLDNIFQLLIQKVKIGFTFDAAPSVDTTQVALLTKDKKMSFVNDYLKEQNNNLIIGENYDVLKNLIVLERERERERGAKR